METPLNTTSVPKANNEQVPENKSNSILNILNLIARLIAVCMIAVACFIITSIGTLLGGSCNLMPTHNDCTVENFIFGISVSWMFISFLVTSFFIVKDKKLSYTPDQNRPPSRTINTLLFIFRPSTALLGFIIINGFLIYILWR